ncbi:hypothetical protein LX66_1922 [Chitinophaga japonensis]|uniref:Transcriptional regulator n=1 Tax=Chitinophaga japonensis TaxID=104662 RepID=A0A562T2H9_CHIJA|nr:hypothetical protein LX66_1922 [Chitinophaga japonensis]
MDTNEKLATFFRAIENDPRISITHIGVFSAILQYWQSHEGRNPVEAYSYDIMPLAKISSSKTYHRCIRDLNAYGYVRYEASFKRNQASKIYLN